MAFMIYIPSGLMAMYSAKIKYTSCIGFLGFASGLPGFWLLMMAQWLNHSGEK